MTEAAASFAAYQAIEAGDWDYYLVQLFLALRKRQAVLRDIDNVPPPTKAMLASGHQVWVVVNGPGLPHWEVRGTGAVLE